MNSAEIIKEWRVARGLSQHEAADKLGVSQAYYSKVELGKRAVDPKKVHDWADKMGLDGSARVNFIDMATVATIPDWVRADISALRSRVNMLLDLSAHRDDAAPPLPSDRKLSVDQLLVELTNLRRVNRALLDRLDIGAMAGADCCTSSEPVSPRCHPGGLPTGGKLIEGAA